VQEHLAQRDLTAVTERDWRSLLEELSPISETYLRHLLHDAGVPIEQPFDGVRQATLEELEQSLVEMERVYSEARECADHAKAQYCRNAVIQAKDHARWTVRSPKTSEEKKILKREMIQWMLIWLENPGVFPAWVKLRKSKL
jgi:hypothetical protein